MLINLLLNQLPTNNDGEFSFKDENVNVTLKIKREQRGFRMWLRVSCKDKFTYGCNNIKVEGSSQEEIIKHQLIEISNQLLIVGYSKSAISLLRAL